MLNKFKKYGILLFLIGSLGLAGLYQPQGSDPIWMIEVR